MKRHTLARSLTPLLHSTKGPVEQSKRYMCQLLRQADHRLAESRTWQWRFGHYRTLAYKIAACDVRWFWRKSAEAFKIHCQIPESRTGKPTMVTLKIQIDCFTVYDTAPLGDKTYVRSHLGCGTGPYSSVFAVLANIQKKQTRCKYTRFWNEVEFDLEH